MTVLRFARPEDAPEVARLHVRAWQSAYRGLLPEEFLAGLDPVRRAAGYSFGDDRDGAPRTLVAEADGRIRGFVAFGASYDVVGSGEIYGLYVDPDSWRGGFGSLLMTEARARLAASGLPEVVLWVLYGNERADAFYRADGWAHDGTERHDDIGEGWRAASTATCEIPAIHELRYRRRL